MSELRFGVGRSTDYFPGFERSSQIELFSFMISMRNIDNYIRYYDYFLTIPCILFNIFHFLILTRKNMRKTSINIILTAIAIFDIQILVNETFAHYLEKINHVEMSSEKLETHIFLEIISTAAKDFLIRCSLWLAISIALIRIVSMRNSMNKVKNTASSPKNGYNSIILAASASFLVALLHVYSFKVQYLSAYDEFYYKKSKSFDELSSHEYNFTWNTHPNPTIIFWYNGFDGLIATVIPCVTFPLLCYTLVTEFKKAKMIRLTITPQIERSDNITTFVILFITDFTIMELVKCLCKTLNAYFETDGMKMIMASFARIVSEISFLNTISRGILSYALLPQYRISAKNILQCGRTQIYNMSNIHSRGSTPVSRKSIVRIA